MRGWSPTSKTRIRAKNAATFVAAPMNATTGVGAPSYTSGVHIWNGAAETLNAKPTTSNAIARSARACEPVCPASAWTMPGAATPTIFVDVAAPYAIATP